MPSWSCLRLRSVGNAPNGPLFLIRLVGNPNPARLVFSHPCRHRSTGTPAIFKADSTRSTRIGVGFENGSNFPLHGK